MRVHPRNGKEHVPRELTLNTDYKLLIISLVDLPGQLVNLRAAQNRRTVEKVGTETNRRQRGELICIPLTKAGNLRRWLTNRHNAIQVISVVNRNLVDAIFEGPRIQPIPGHAAEQHSLGVQLIRKPNAGAEMVPVHVLSAPATACRTRPQFRHSTQEWLTG